MTGRPIMVAGQVWRRPDEALVVVTGLRWRADRVAGVWASYVVVDGAELDHGELPCDEFAAGFELMYDATLVDPWAVVPGPAAAA